MQVHLIKTYDVFRLMILLKILNNFTQQVKKCSRKNVQKNLLSSKEESSAVEKQIY